MFRKKSNNRTQQNRPLFSYVQLLITFCTLASVVNGYEWGDDFSTYAEGSLGEPRWSARSVDWTMERGGYLCGGLIDSFSIADGYADCREIDIVAVITALNPTQRDTWRVAGVAIYNNSKNFWHFALVESPSDKNNRHFLELSEKREDIWLAQENLTVTASEHMDFDWQYNQTYRLRVSMTTEGIEGSLSDMDGNILARKAYAFDKAAVTSGRPALHGSAVKICFDQVEAKSKKPVPPQEKPAMPELTIKTWDGIKRAPTGYFHVEKIDNRWWSIAPNGHAFYAIGTDHCNYNGHWCEELNYAPYGKKNRQKYPSAEIWAEQTAGRLKDWGFNLVAAGHSEQLRYRGLAHTLWLGCGAEFSSISDIVPKIYWTGLPNVFDPRFASFCKIKARQVLEEHVDDPWVFGIFIDNELEWYGKDYSLGGVFDEAMKKDAAHTAKIALVDMLRSKYTDVQSLNNSWETSFTDFNDLLQLEKIDADSDVLAKDKLDYLALVAEKYFATTTAAIREIDKNHMILGSRFAGNAPEPCWTAAGKYCDIVSVNQYPFIDLQTGQMLDALNDLVRYSEWTNRPLMLTEWSFPSLDSGLPCMHGAGMRVETQQQRSQAFTIYQSSLFGLPFIVGSDFFMWVDEPELGISSTFPEDSNYGLVNEDGQPYEELTKAATLLNPKVYDIHSKALDPDLKGISDKTVKYQPGIEWPKDLTEQALRYPMIVSNKTNSEIINGIISFTLSEVDANYDWSGISAGSLCLKNKKDQDVLWQFDSFDKKIDPFDEICIEISRLGAMKSQTYFLYINRASNLSKIQTDVDFEKNENGFEISNNVIRLVKNQPDGDFVDEFYYQDVLLGRYNPMVHQNQGQNQWIQAEHIIDYQVSPGPLRLLVHLSAKGGDESTVNSDQINSDKPLAYLVEHRLAVYPDLPWFDSRFVRITNQSSTEMKLCNSFFYIVPNIQGNGDDDNLVPRVPNYYQKNYNLWHDPTGYEYGALALGDTDLRVSFYINPEGGKHPDAMLHFDPPIKIAPLQYHNQFDCPPLHIIGNYEDSQNTILPQHLLNTIKQRYALQVKFYDVEQNTEKK